MNKLFARLAACTVAIVASPEGVYASPPSSPASMRMAPATLQLPIPALKSHLVFSLPAWRAVSSDETPYQLLQLCDQAGNCDTLSDLRGMPGISIASDPSLGLSPDGLYVIVLRHVGVDAESHTIRGMTYELYGLAERGPVAFRTAQGTRASTDHIQGWDPASGHGLETSTGRRKKAVALPAKN